ncbi:MAG: hypothetical protein DMG96_05495 [Acidobacteria bacterium]|nr:MAG: hypothetical protein DMG98_14960 [Acidobacteriota bacterium]PYV79047.1 MAG: hypothetical protein DMG96_05495 [Acidobacteriota bacterium]
MNFGDEHRITMIPTLKLVAIGHWYFRWPFGFSSLQRYRLGMHRLFQEQETDRDCTKKSLTPPACISSHTHLRTLYVS